jgi:urease accessory protein
MVDPARASTTMSNWLAWQLVDSAFPTGGFAHSWGLEAAWQQGEIADRDALWRFVQAALLQTGHGVLPLVTAAHRAPERLLELDALADAFLTNAVANRASRVQGRTLHASASRIWPEASLERWTGPAWAGRSHVGPMTGVVLRVVGLPLATAQRLVLFAAARGVLSAAVRLGVAGSYQAQQLQHDCGPVAEWVLGRCGGLDVDDLAQTAPLADILQGAHDRLYSRLFQS